MREYNAKKIGFLKPAQVQKWYKTFKIAFGYHMRMLWFWILPQSNHSKLCITLIKRNKSSLIADWLHASCDFFSAFFSSKQGIGCRMKNCHSGGHICCAKEPTTIEAKIERTATHISVMCRQYIAMLIACKGFFRRSQFSKPKLTHFSNKCMVKTFF